MMDVFFVIAGGICGVWIVYTVLFLAPWLPTFAKDMDRIVDLADLSDGDVFYELGSGDGRVSLYVGKRCPQAHIVGVEMSYLLYGISRARQMCARVRNVRFMRRDLYRTDLGKADVIYVFATAHSACRLAHYLQTSVKKDARIISYNFRLPFDHATTREKRVKQHAKDMTLYVYDNI